MSKKMLFIALITLLFFVITGRCFADDVSAQLKQADTYRKNKKYQQAEEVCQVITRDYAGTEYALKAQKKLVILYILMERQADAQAALDKMIADFSSHSDLPMDLYRIVKEYRKAGRSDKANSIEQLITQRWPDSPYGKPSLDIPKGEILSYIKSGNYTKAQTAIYKLIADFSGHAYLPGTLYHIAGGYEKAQKYEEAKSIYTLIAQQYPGSWCAGKAQLDVPRVDILSLIHSGEDRAAQSAIDSLIADFPAHSDLPELLYNIAETYRGLKKYGDARKLHQRVVDNWPDSERAIWSQRGVIFSSIGLGDDAGTEAGIEKLLMQFSSNKLIAKMVYQVAGELNNKNDQKAQELYEYVIDKYSSSEFVPLARVNIGDIKLRLGDDKAARVIFDRVLADFAGHPVLTRAVDLMAYGYYRKALLKDKKGFDEQANWYYQKTIAECERIITQLPETRYITAEACYFSAVCYSRLGQHEKAIEYYQKVVDNWPEYKLAWLAQFKVAKTYKWLLRFGVMSESEAEAAITVTFEQLLASYPDCPAASAAHKWLNYYHKKSSEGGQK